MKTFNKKVKVELETGKSFEVNVAVQAYKENYGADADGNRGVMTWFVHDYEFAMPPDLTEEEVIETDEQVEDKINDID